MWDGAAVALGMISAMCIPLMLSAIGGDPDDYWDMPESMRRMGIMLPLGKDGRFLTLPMSIEHRAAYGIGELLGTVVCGSENLPASEITFQAFEQLSQILPLDLTEGNGSMLSLVPTAVRPEVEIAFNKNWIGMPIYKEPFNKNTPAFRNVYQSTNPNYIAMSKWLNEVQGGGDYERAGVQVNQGRRITFLFHNQCYSIEKHYLSTKKRYEHLHYTEQYSRSSSQSPSKT